jgi:uncharacterized protein
MTRLLLGLAATGLAVVCLPCLAAPAVPQGPLPEGVARQVLRSYGDGEVRSFDRVVDLNGDGRPEIVVYLVGPTVCGTGGCSLLVFTPTDAGYRQVADISVSRPPIRASSATSSGWRNLIVRTAGGGVASADVELAFDGRSYPRNPTVPGPRVGPARLAGAELLIGEFKSMREGRPLAAADAVPGPAFDCSKATKPSEKLACSDTELSTLDRTLAAAYAKGLSPSSDWTERDREASRSAQRAWLAERDQCAKAADRRDCVASAYRRRIAELRIRDGDAGPVPASHAYLCPGLERQPVTAVYDGRTDPPAAVITVGDEQVIAFIARSGSGARYAAAGMELWEHHGEATLTWLGKTHVCKVN